MAFIPDSFSEKMLYAVTRLNVEGGSGTGFFFNFLHSGSNFPVLVSCRHVVRDTYLCGFNIHEGRDDNGELVPSGKVRELRIGRDDGAWIFHPDKDVDLAILPLSTILSHEFSPPDPSPFIFYLDEGVIWDDERLRQLNVVEDILMIGCPIGLYDEKNGFPLMRRGISSTHPYVDYKDVPVGLIDGPCFRGSSGSPLIRSFDGMRIQKNGGIHQGIAWASGVLLGVLFSMYVSDNPVPMSIPCDIDATTGTKAPAHLGRYVKAKKLLDFKPLLPDLVGIR